MSDPNSADKPLDPETAAIVTRVRRLMMISGATTLIAVAVVLGVIGYRVFTAGGSASVAAQGSAPAGAVSALLPKGAKVTATAVSGDRIAVTIETAGGTEIRLFDLHSLKPAGQITLKNEP